MAFVHAQDGKPYLFAFFRDASGRLRHKSTGTADRREAEAICKFFQDISNRIKSGNLSSAAARKLIEEEAARISEGGKPIETVTVAEYFAAWLNQVEKRKSELKLTVIRKRPSYARLCKLFEHVVDELSDRRVPRYSIAQWFTDWIKTIEREVEESTYERYAGIVESFLKHLGGARGRDPLHFLRTDDIERYRSARAAEVSSTTVNHEIKVLRMSLRIAKGRHLIAENPAEAVKALGRQDRHERRDFTLDELKRLWAAAASPEWEDWRGAVLFSLYAGGLRISDAANLCENHVDLRKGEFWITTRKTRRAQSLPLAKPLQRWLEAREAHRAAAAGGKIVPLNPEAKAAIPANSERPLFPTLYGKRSGTLSNRFTLLLVKAGLAIKRSHKRAKDGKGRSGTRKLQELSFHSLRHTASSLLANAGVSDVIARDIVGHESKAVARQYQHVERRAKQKALDTMPDLQALVQQRELGI